MTTCPRDPNAPAGWAGRLAALPDLTALGDTSGCFTRDAVLARCPETDTVTTRIEKRFLWSEKILVVTAVNHRCISPDDVELCLEHFSSVQVDIVKRPFYKHITVVAETCWAATP